jgi:hypothetical protein
MNHGVGNLYSPAIASNFPPSSGVLAHSGFLGWGAQFLFFEMRPCRSWSSENKFFIRCETVFLHLMGSVHCSSFEGAR